MRMVIAFGGNALGNTFMEQKSAVKGAVKVVADLIEEGHEVVITHGNGPQVGMLKNHMPMEIPLSTCVAMTQSYIGFDIQNLMHEELQQRGMKRTVVSLITQVSVDAEDQAFQKPTKPIGAFVDADQARKLEKTGCVVVEDSGRGYRQVVASPKPKDIVEIDAIRSLVEQGNVVITCGGGGIPVVDRGDRFQEVDAVIDKDLVSARLAQMIEADFLVLLTSVDRVAIHYGCPDEQWISKMTVKQAMSYAEEGEFAAGSMLPKIEAAIEFTASKAGRKTLITKLENAAEGIRGMSGTLIA